VTVNGVHEDEPVEKDDTGEQVEAYMVLGVQLVQERVLDAGVQVPEIVTGTQLVQVEGLTVVVATQEDEVYAGQLVGTDFVIVVGGNITISVVVDVTTD
jgi:hypothetical protein